MKNHEKAFSDIKNYYNDITLNNLALINSLKVIQKLKKIYLNRISVSWCIGTNRGNEKERRTVRKATSRNSSWKSKTPRSLTKS